jgi:hypothetical protein
MDFENLVLLVMSENYLFLVVLQERPANVNILDELWCVSERQ